MKKNPENSPLKRQTVEEEKKTSVNLHLGFWSISIEVKELRENIRKVRKNDAFPCTSSDHNHLKMDNINQQLPTTVYELLII